MKPRNDVVPCPVCMCVSLDSDRPDPASRAPRLANAGERSERERERESESLGGPPASLVVRHTSPTTRGTYVRPPPER